MKAIFVALILGIAPALAQESCPAAPSVPAGTGPGDAPGLAVAQAVMLALKPTPQIHYSVAARRSGDPKVFGGTAMLAVTNPGTWRISLGSAAWIAVAQNGMEVRSATHSHGDACLVKMVDFPLQPGKAIIEISAAPDSAVRLMASTAP